MEVNQELDQVSDTNFSPSQVKTIMECAIDTRKCGIAEDSVHLTVKAVELFVRHLVKLSFNQSNGGSVDYIDVVDVVHSTANLFFLKEIIPRKITVKEWKTILERDGDLTVIQDLKPESETSSSEGERDEEDDSTEDSSEGEAEESSEEDEHVEEMEQEDSSEGDDGDETTEDESEGDKGVAQEEQIEKPDWN